MFLRKKLKNGMILCLEKRDLPVVSLSITNRFGAAFEKSEEKGIAHFMEHLLFTGTETRTHEDISREIEKKGGILNAFTSHEVTSFWFKLPSEHLFSGLDILTDMLKNPAFREDKFEKEKKVILEEIKMYHDTPQRYVFDVIEGCLYEKPFGETVIGNAKTVSALKRDFVAKYFSERYNPGNYIVCVVGDADFNKLCEYFEKNFSANSDNVLEGKIILKNSDFTEERDGIDQAHLLFGMHAPLPGEKDYSALEVLNAYLAQGMSSKLFLKIREEKGLAYSVRGNIDSEKNYSYYTIYVGTTKEAVPEVKKMILEGFESVKNMTDKELNEAKEQLIGLRRVSCEESTNVMNEIMFAELNGNGEDYYKREEKIRAVKLEDVKRMAKLKKYSFAAIVPK